MPYRHPSTSPAPDEDILVGRSDEPHPRVRITPNGSIFIGDGTVAPATSISLDGAFDAIQESLIDAAGDVIQGSANNTAARLAIGTARQRLQVNSGATGLEYSDITPTRAVLGPWVDTDLADALTASVMVMPAGATFTELPVFRAGGVTGIRVLSNEGRTAGTATFDATINGTVTGLQAVLDATNTTAHGATQAITADPVVAGDRIGVKVTTASWTPTTADVAVVVEVSELG
jgi:hypothetical protein